MPPRPVARELAHVIQKVRGDAKSTTDSCAGSLRAIEERQSKEVEYFLRSCGVRLRHAVL